MRTGGEPAKNVARSIAWQASPMIRPPPLSSLWDQWRLGRPGVKAKRNGQRCVDGPAEELLDLFGGPRKTPVEAHHHQWRLRTCRQGLFDFIQLLEGQSRAAFPRRWACPCESP